MNKLRHKLLDLIANAEFHSGEALSKELGVSRTAINKGIHQLQQMGLDIETRYGMGYRLRTPVELLDAAAVQNALSSPAQSLCRDIEVLFETESTNSYLLEQMQQSACSGRVVLAEFQSHGKGRRGHEWVSPLASGLYLSVAWQTEKAYASPGLLSLFVGLAVARALTRMGVAGIGLKWPNDILVGQEKLGGILVEMQGEANGPTSMVIGIGINIALPDAIKTSIDKPVTDLQAQLASGCSRNALAAALMNELFALLDSDIDRQREALLAEWGEFDRYRDQEAEVLLPDTTISGRLKGVDHEGCLLVSVDGQLQRYTCGEISLRVPA